jgi:ATP-binding protein involved in chromosome partitioning
MVRKRFERIRFTLLVASGKGGVGKSMIAATSAAILARKGFSVGLLDLDLHGPTAPTILGVSELPREEEGGLAPPVSHGVKVMSIDLFAPEKPVPMSGRAKRNAIKELLALTDWGELDYLIVDMPPGTGDETMATASLLPREKAALLVTTPSRLSVRVAKRAAELLLDMGVPLLGVVENMAVLTEEGRAPFGRGAAGKLASELGIPLLAEIPLDPRASAAADSGDMNALLETEFASAVERALERAGLLTRGENVSRLDTP